MNVAYPQTETNSDVPMKRCTDCDKEFPLIHSNFEYLQGGGGIGKMYFRNQCRACHRERQKSSKGKKPIQVIKLPKGTPEQCGSCGTMTGNILGDVDIASAHKYGYLCSKCYKLVRDFQSDAGRIRKVLEYVESTR